MWLGGNRSESVALHGNVFERAGAEMTMMRAVTTATSGDACVCCRNWCQQRPAERQRQNVNDYTRDHGKRLPDAIQGTPTARLRAFFSGAIAQPGPGDGVASQLISY
jgi:hypothetical protein